MFAQKLFEPIVHSHSWQQWKCLKNSKFMWFLLLKNSCRFLKEDLNPLCTVTVDDSGNFWRIPKSSDFYYWRILGDFRKDLNPLCSVTVDDSGNLCAQITNDLEKKNVAKSRVQCVFLSELTFFTRHFS